MLLDGDRDLFQGDMRLTPLQRLLAMTGGDVSLAGKSSNTFGSAKDQSLLWMPNKVVPYEISPSLGKLINLPFNLVEGGGVRKCSISRKSSLEYI